MTKILITGSSGQIGSYLVEHFFKDYDVIGLDIKKSGISEVDEITTLGDIRDEVIVGKLVKESDIIIHAAAQLNIKTSLEKPIFDADINIKGTLNLLEAARKHRNISKFVYLSSSVVYGNTKYLPIDETHPLNPLSPYGLSKMTAEKYCSLYYEVFGLPVVCVRPFNVYSAREDPNSSYSSVIAKFVYNINNNRPLTIFGDGRQIRDFIHAKDAASFIEILIEKHETNGEVYNLGNGIPITIYDIAKKVLQLNEKDEKNNIIFEKKEKGKIENSYADIKKSQKIGYKQKITLDMGINEIINFYKK